MRLLSSSKRWQARIPVIPKLRRPDKKRLIGKPPGHALHTALQPADLSTEGQRASNRAGYLFRPECLILLPPSRRSMPPLYHTSRVSAVAFASLPAPHFRNRSSASIHWQFRHGPFYDQFVSWGKTSGRRLHIMPSPSQRPTQSGLVSDSTALDCERESSTAPTQVDQEAEKERERIRAEVKNRFDQLREATANMTPEERQKEPSWGKSNECFGLQRILRWLTITSCRNA